MLFNRKSVGRGHPTPVPESDPSAAPGQLPPAAAESPHAGPARAPTQSFIDASLAIVGDLCSEGDVQIDGRICGNVTCAQLIVGAGAAITGTVRAEQAIVRGSITGTINASVVILQETARVKSDIAYTLLAIDDGATFEGAVRRSARPREEAATASPLTELERTITGESAGTTASPWNSADAGDEPAPDVASPGQRRNANGHADAQR
jgi:cytoskeletal protein CcmA (bactofilin family)